MLRRARCSIMHAHLRNSGAPGCIHRVYTASGPDCAALAAQPSNRLLRRDGCPPGRAPGVLALCAGQQCRGECWHGRQSMAKRPGAQGRSPASQSAPRAAAVWLRALCPAIGVVQAHFAAAARPYVVPPPPALRPHLHHARSFSPVSALHPLLAQRLEYLVREYGDASKAASIGGNGERGGWRLLHAFFPSAAAGSLEVLQMRRPSGWRRPGSCCRCCTYVAGPSNLT